MSRMIWLSLVPTMKLLLLALRLLFKECLGLFWRFWRKRFCTSQNVEIYTHENFNIRYLGTVNPATTKTYPALYFCDLSSPSAVTSPAEHDVHKQLK